MLVIKNIVFIAVGAIVLLHTITQHEHSETDDIVVFQAHNNYETVFEDLLLTFSLNHGEGHLEHFVKTHLPITKFVVNEIIIISFAEKEITNYISQSENIYIYKDFPPDPLRGPPVSNIA